MLERNKNKIIAILMLFFLCITIPAALKRPTGGRSGERQGQTAGMIRAYCVDFSNHTNKWGLFKSPQVHYGNQAFNLEFPLFELIQGKFASLTDGPACDSVEPIAKVTSSIISSLLIFGIFLLGQFLGGTVSGMIAATLVFGNEMWIRYATYSMIDNRIIVTAVFAILFTLKRNFLLTFLFWSLVLIQKPQAFSFLAPFWLILELTRDRAFFKKSQNIPTIVSFVLAFLVGVAYYKWSVKVNLESDLPWVTWMGPRTQKWFFGDWSERFTRAFYKGVFFDWFRKTGINIVLPLITLLWFLSSRKFSYFKSVKQIFIITLPFIIARFAAYFVFYNVYVVHEYYSLIVNTFSILTCGLIWGVVYEQKCSRVPYQIRKYATFLFLGILTIPQFNTYFEFLKNINNASDWRYQPEWDVQLFPKKNVLVAMAGSNSGRDILPLYFSKQQGYAWCAKNKEFAPRAFWKSQGVEYVAWWIENDPTTKMPKWEVLSMEDDLKRARENNWSSDINDSWAGKTMSEWAKVASAKGYDPCGNIEHFDPKKWN